ncbi:hypothetical protein ACTXT7_003200 [Hymenolepis weldensis]
MIKSPKYLGQCDHIRAKPKLVFSLKRSTLVGDKCKEPEEIDLTKPGSFANGTPEVISIKSVKTDTVIYSPAWYSSHMYQTTPHIGVQIWITQIIGVNTDEEDVVNLKELQHKLEPIQKGQTRVVLLFVTRRYAEHVFTVADRLGIIGKEWAWIVSEQCLGAKNLPLGALSVRLAQSDELRHVEDAARVVTEGIIKFTRREPNVMFGLQSVYHCRQELESPRNLSRSWLYYNTKLYQAMTEVIFEDGETGHVEFDSHGDRVGALYDIVNVQPHSDCGVPKPSCKPVINIVGKYVQLSLIKIAGG